MAAGIAMNNAGICQAIMLNLGKELGLELVAAFDSNQKKEESKSLDNQRYIAARRPKARLAEWGKRVANIDGYRGVGGAFRAIFVISYLKAAVTLDVEALGQLTGEMCL
jgi:hypothetical protein